MLIQCNKLVPLEDSMVMYGIYNTETEKLINTIHLMHNITTPNEKLFAGLLHTRCMWYAYIQGIQHYAINSLLYLRTIKGKYIKMYKEFILQMHIYAREIRVLAKGCLPISLITPLKLKETLNVVKVTIRKTNPDYDIKIKTTSVL